MRKQFIECDTREEAEQMCPWAAEIIENEVCGGFWCFESMSDVQTWMNQL